MSKWNTLKSEKIKTKTESGETKTTLLELQESDKLYFSDGMCYRHYRIMANTNMVCTGDTDMFHTQKDKYDDIKDDIQNNKSLSKIIIKEIIYGVLKLCAMLLLLAVAIIVFLFFLTMAGACIRIVIDTIRIMRLS